MQTGSVTNYLTFNAADELTRVDKPNNAYDTYTYDNNGNCTSMNVFYPQPLLASKNTENDKTLMRVHYPADYAPAPVNRWRNLSPYLPDVSVYGTMSEIFARLDPKKAKWDREERWRELCMPMRDPDETTSLTYSSDNNLTNADLPNGNDLDFKYDAAGRRVEKKLTSTTTNNNVTTTTVTTYKYHYIGSQITTIEIDQTQTTGESTTTTKDDEMRIHLGANSRPISFEYYTENQGTQQTTSATYYYHYDLHGNVIRVTNSSGSTVISYTYDQLGTIVSETNSGSICNPFTYMGEAQVIHDVEFDTSSSSPKTGLYNSGSGYYNPETGTLLGGSGEPASTNPTSTSAEEPTAQSTKPAGQLGAHAAIAAIGGGVPSTAGCASSGDVEQEPATTSAPRIQPAQVTQCQITMVEGIRYDVGTRAGETMQDMQDMQNRIREWWIETQAWRDRQKRQEEEKKKDGHYAGDGCPECGDAIPKVVPLPMPVWTYKDLPEEVKALLRQEYRIDHPETKSLSDKDIDDNLELDLQWVLWAGEGSGTSLVGYQLKGHKPVFFWGPEADVKKPGKVAAGMTVGARFDPSIIFEDNVTDEDGKIVERKTYHPGAT